MSNLNFDSNDELEPHLHSALRDYAPEAANHLWAGIEARLPEQRRRRPVLFWWLTSLGGAVILGGMLHNTQQIAKPALRQATTQCSAEIGQSPEPRTSAAAGLRRSPVTAPPAKIATSIWPLTQRVGRNTSNRIADLTNQSASVETAPLVSGSDGSTQHTSFEKTPLESTELTPTKSSSPFAAPTPLPHKIPQKPSVAPPTISSAYVLPKTYPQHRWQIGLAAAPVWIWPVAGIDAPHPDGQMVFTEQHQGSATGWQKGISVGYQCTPRWRLTTGLYQRQFTQIASHTATLRLMDGICLNQYSSGPKEYEFQYALHSGNSTSGVTVRIAQVDSLVKMPGDEPFMLAMRTTRQNTDWVFPLTVQRNFGHGRWQGFIQGGGELGLTAQTEIQVEHFTEQCMDLCFASGQTPTLMVAKQHNASVSWLLGAGLEYRISPRWTLSMAPTFFGKKSHAGLSLNTGLSLKL